MDLNQISSLNVLTAVWLKLEITNYKRRIYIFPQVGRNYINSFTLMQYQVYLDIIHIQWFTIETRFTNYTMTDEDGAFQLAPAYFVVHVYKAWDTSLMSCKFTFSIFQNIHGVLMSAGSICFSVAFISVNMAQNSMIIHHWNNAGHQPVMNI